MSPRADTFTECPEAVTEYAVQAVDYVQRALSLTLEFDSDTLPVLDHYLRSVPATDLSAAQLVAATAGAYFGEVVRRGLGGHWEMAAPADATSWRLVLPGGLSFSPFGIVLTVILRVDSHDEIDNSLRAPSKMRSHVEGVFERMADVTEANYYSLCCRLDTLEHVQAVLLAIAAQDAERRKVAN